MEDERRPTVVLQNAFMRWYPGWAECCKYREEGNRFAQEGNFPLAVQCYNKALETGEHRKCSHDSLWTLCALAGVQKMCSVKEASCMSGTACTNAPVHRIMQAGVDRPIGW
jgi:hypothetical protein